MATATNPSSNPLGNSSTELTSGIWNFNQRGELHVACYASQTCIFFYHSAELRNDDADSSRQSKGMRVPEPCVIQCPCSLHASMLYSEKRAGFAALKSSAANIQYVRRAIDNPHEHLC
eukprot:3076487-Amphidinium_carterae.1